MWWVFLSHAGNIDTLHVSFQRQIEEIKDVFLRELKEVNEKYVASEQALRELEERYGGRKLCIWNIDLSVIIRIF